MLAVGEDERGTALRRHADPHAVLTARQQRGRTAAEAALGAGGALAGVVEVEEEGVARAPRRLLADFLVAILEDRRGLRGVVVRKELVVRSISIAAQALVEAAAGWKPVGEDGSQPLP